MSSQRVSLPGIHELFPEHLMYSQPIPGSSKTHTTPRPIHRDHARNVPGPNSPPSYPQARSAVLPAPPKGQSTYQSTSPHIHVQRHSRDYHGQRVSDAALPSPSLNTLGRPSFASEPMSHPLSRGYDINQDGLAHPVTPIPASARIPRSQDQIRYPDPQSSGPRSGMQAPGTSQSPAVLNDAESLSGDEASSSGGPPGIPRKHVCPICGKAFNRPSSLKIHYNTHTGETPFRCPWPRCGREFNVNSNMRRHLRNHAPSANQEIPDDGARRRRRRSSTSSSGSPVAVTRQPASGMRTQPPGNAQIAMPRYDVPSHVSETSRHPPRYSPHDYGKEYYRMDVDEPDQLQVSEDLHKSNRAPTHPRGTVHASTYLEAFPPHQEHRFHRSPSSASMRTRALTPGSSFHSSSPSPSPSPSLSPASSSFTTPPPSTLTSPTDSPAVLPRPQTNKYQYSPSAPFLRTTGDSHVSTALRPAFSAGSAPY